MPLKYMKTGWHSGPGQQRPAFSSGGYRVPADLHLLVAQDITTQRPGNQLPAKTHAHYGDTQYHRPLYQPDFIGNPVLRLVYTVRCTEENQAGRGIQVAIQSVPWLDTDQLIGDLALLQVVAKEAPLAAGDVTK